MVINLYAILFVVSLLMIIAMAAIGQKLNITQYILLFAAIMISILGDYIISVSDTLNMAIMGQNMVYLGGVFTPILVLFSTMKICHMKIPKALWISLVSLAGIILFFVFNVQSSQLYYKSLELGTANGMTILIKERGPLHMLYMFLMFGCVFLNLGVSIYSFIKKQKVAYKSLSFILDQDYNNIGEHAGISEEEMIVPLIFIEN